MREELDTTVSVFVFCGDGATPLDMRSVDRVVPDDGAPLRVLVLHRRHLAEGGRRGRCGTLDLTRGFATTNNFSTSYMSAVVTQQISETVFQFPEISGLEFTIEGERWCGWEATCDDAEVPLLSRR